MLDKIYIGNYWFNTLVAVTEKEQSVGLMYKKWPPPVMIFPFKTASYRKFWMKNTPSALDIIFVRSGKVVGIFKGEPLSTAGVGPNEPADLVVELPHGTATRFGLFVGDEVRACYSAETAIKIMRLG